MICKNKPLEVNRNSDALRLVFDSAALHKIKTPPGVVTALGRSGTRPLPEKLLSSLLCVGTFPIAGASDWMG
jgi:hypothetical protein